GQLCDAGIVDDVLEGEQEVIHGRSVVSHAASVAVSLFAGRDNCCEPQSQWRMRPLLLWMSMHSPVGSWVWAKSLMASESSPRRWAAFAGRSASRRSQRSARLNAGRGRAVRFRPTSRTPADAS